MGTAILFSLCKRIRYNIITSTTAAGSGHPSSSLSAVELTTVLFFDGYLKQDVKDFENPLNDKFVLSKGHAAPLLYSIYEAAGVLKQEELLTLRKFSSRLQGHPTPYVPFVDVTTGSLGQGLSVGVGMALGFAKRAAYNAKRLETIHDTRYTPRVFVLLGDSEFSEGQNYEAMQLAAHYKLGNLVAILDVNRLGQRGETQMGWNLEEYKKRAEAFGWNAIVIEDGNNIEQVRSAFAELRTTHYELPTILIAKTKKGAGVSFMEDKDGWHGKAIPKDKLEDALKEIGEIDFSINGAIEKPVEISSPKIGDQLKSVEISNQENTTGLNRFQPISADLNWSQPISTREAYGHALADLAKQNKNILALDAETSNSTYAEFVKKETPEQFVECYIAEQNMVSMALGLSKVGFIPFASSFAAFLSRAFDQIRMSQYSVRTSLNQTFGSENQLSTDKLIPTDLPAGKAGFNRSQLISTLNIVGSHAGCSIGVDGASQMALEDISMMRSIRESTVLYPADGISTYKLTQAMAAHPGINYLRTTREKTPTLYGPDEEFPIGGLKVHYANRESQNAKHLDALHGTRYTIHALIISAGITLHEALKAQKILEAKQIHTVVVDLYSIKPLDSKTLIELAKQTKHLIVVEDHYESGGIGEAILAVRQQSTANSKFTHLCVRKEPCSGTPEELLRYEKIDAEAIVKAITT